MNHRSRAQLRQGPLATALDDPSMERYRTSRARRRLSLLQIALSVILVTVPLLLYQWHHTDPAMPLWAFAVAAVVLFLPWMFVTGMCNGSVSGIFDLRDDQLDEFERRDRDAAYRTAYRALIPVTMVLLGTVSGLAAAGRGALVFWLVSLFLFTLLGLPQHIAAWRLAARGDADAANADVGSHGS
ncbi:MAG: hypothetical protein ACKOCV_06740 [Gemmatimonadota bacterium]